MIAVVLSFVCSSQDQEPQISKVEVLRVGHVIEVRGALDEAGRFVAQKIVLEPPSADDALLGTVPEDQTDPLVFTLLGQPVETDEETKWEGLETGSLAGKRVKVEGSWKGPRRFRADSIERRGAGRDRIAGRLDELVPVAGGLQGRVMIFTVVIPADTEVEHEKPVAEYALAPARKIGVTSAEDYEVERDEDDSFGEGFALSDTLRLLGQFEVRSDYEDNFDLNEDDEEDRLDLEASLRLRLAWNYSESLVGLTEGRYTERKRREEDVNSDVDGTAAVGETWLQWRNVAGRAGFDLTAGRQDFDDPREWIYDQNLDALRGSWIRPDWRFDLSVATVLTDGSERDEESNNLIAYLSNNDDDEHLAAWVLLRETDEFPVEVRNPNSGNDDFVDLGESSLHFGARAIGEWLPQNEVWAELAFLQGDRDGAVFQGNTTAVDNFDVSAWAYDLGTTWSPPFLAPLYFTVGYALGSGESEINESYRQTGYHDNTDRFGGVTSFSYYGELFEPELSNMGITTLGLGAMIAERTSLDLVFHTYEQDVVTNLYSPRPSIEVNVDPQPNGLDADLGWELDAILGYRRYKNWDIEIVAAMFEPGDGLTNDDTAYFGKFQLRYRF
jgi:hypothetical protein